MSGKTLAVVSLAMVVSGCVSTMGRPLTLAERSSQMQEFISVSDGVPANVRVPGVYRGLIDRMWLRSPTFRRQCARIAQAGQLVVTIEEHPSTPATSHRARTEIEPRRGGLRTASVSLNPALRDQLVELIAHEFEHIVEWLDGVDYDGMSGESGVSHGAQGAVETVRAITIGKLVAQEVATGNGMPSAMTAF